MLEDMDPRARSNQTIAHCSDPETLREALGVVLHRLSQLGRQDGLDDATRATLDHLCWMCACLGIQASDRPVGRREHEAARENGPPPGATDPHK